MNPKNCAEYWDHYRAEWRPKYAARDAEKQAQLDAVRDAEKQAQRDALTDSERRTNEISTRIPIELWERLEKYIDQHGQTKQWLITRALDVYLREWGKK